MRRSLLIQALISPASTASFSPPQWTATLRLARRELLLGTLAAQLNSIAGLTDSLPSLVRDTLAAALRTNHNRARRLLWDARLVSAELAPLGCPVILLKGAAYAAADLGAAHGRDVGDLDLLIPHQHIPAAEKILRAGRWIPVKTNAYDIDYYHRWMHESPPLRHADRGTDLDLHHTILPLTARPRPDATALIANAQTVEDPQTAPLCALKTLCPADMVLHSAAHLFADGDLNGGLRNLWDIDQLTRQFAHADPLFWTTLTAHAHQHQLTRALTYALRAAQTLLQTPVPPDRVSLSRALPPAPIRWTVETLAQHHMTHTKLGPRRGGWAGFGLYLRSHWLRMPPLLLARHLIHKALRRKPS